MIMIVNTLKMVNRAVQRYNHLAIIGKNCFSGSLPDQWRLMMEEEEWVPTGTVV